MSSTQKRMVKLDLNWLIERDDSDWHQYNKVILEEGLEPNDKIASTWKRKYGAAFVVCLFITCVFYLAFTSGSSVSHVRALILPQSVRNFSFRDKEMNANNITTSPKHLSSHKTIFGNSTRSSEEEEEHTSLVTDDFFKSRHPKNWLQQKLGGIVDNLLHHFNSSLITLKTSKSKTATCPGCVVFTGKREKYRDHFTSYDCRKIRMRPYSYVCLYPPEIDTIISAQIIETGLWEEHILKHVAQVLQRDNDLGLIDIGANIGVFTNLAAKLGHNVLAIEPYAENAMRLITGAKMSGAIERVVLLHNALSDKESIMAIKLSTDNQGDTRVQENKGNIYKRKVEYGYNFTNVITLDNIIPYTNFTKAIIKIDNQGFEHRTFLKCDNLLDTIYVPYIFMEWVILREFYGSEITRSLDKDLTQLMVDKLSGRGYSPYSSVTHKPLPLNMWYAWPEDVYWRHELEDFKA